MENRNDTPELTPEELEALKKRHIRSFVMRRGHISAAQKRALEETLPQYQIEYLPELLDADAAFGRHAPVVLEIGCGMGETTAAIAAAHPEVNFIGCEVFTAVVGALAKRLDEMSLTNVRIIRHDAVEIVRDMIPENFLDGVHIYFPDPWRKARHHKRRLVQRPRTNLFEQKLCKGGYIYFVTDWQEYADFALEELTLTEGLKNKYADFAEPQSWRPKTKFECKGINADRVINELFFEKLQEKV